MPISTERTEGASLAIARTWETIRRAFAEFLTLPTLIIVGFLLLAVATNALERAQLPSLAGLHATLERNVFADAEATAGLLETIAGSLVTVTSITISLLLLALQQTASTLTAEVFDQFLRRRHNQFYFGFFIGVALYSLMTLATVNAPFNPVLAAFTALILTVMALILLLILLYTSINQMRPSVIIDAIHDYTLKARTKHLVIVERTRRAPQFSGEVRLPVTVDRDGYVTRIDVETIGCDAACAAGRAEVVLRASHGSYLSTGDTLAEVVADNQDDAERLVATVLDAIRLERQQDFATDPANGIEELGTIAWTSISTSKSNPAPGLLAIRSLRDLLARWSLDEQSASDSESHVDQLPVVYTDTVMMVLMDTLESLAVASSESMQHQSFTEVLRAFAALLGRVSSENQRAIDNVILRILPALGDHVLTSDLERALTETQVALRNIGNHETATRVETACKRLAQTKGNLHSRSTRAMPPR